MILFRQICQRVDDMQLRKYCEKQAEVKTNDKGEYFLDEFWYCSNDYQNNDNYESFYVREKWRKWKNCYCERNQNGLAIRTSCFWASQPFCCKLFLSCLWCRLFRFSAFDFARSFGSSACSVRVFEEFPAFLDDCQLQIPQSSGKFGNPVLGFRGFGIDFGLSCTGLPGLSAFMNVFFGFLAT